MRESKSQAMLPHRENNKKLCNEKTQKLLNSTCKPNG